MTRLVVYRCDVCQDDCTTSRYEVDVHRLEEGRRLGVVTADYDRIVLCSSCFNQFMTPLLARVDHEWDDVFPEDSEF